MDKNTSQRRTEIEATHPSIWNLGELDPETSKEEEHGGQETSKNISNLQTRHHRGNGLSHVVESEGTRVDHQETEEEGSSLEAKLDKEVEDRKGDADSKCDPGDLNDANRGAVDEGRIGLRRHFPIERCSVADLSRHSRCIVQDAEEGHADEDDRDSVKNGNLIRSFLGVELWEKEHRIE